MRRPYLDFLQSTLHSLRVHAGFAVPALLLMVVAFAALGSLSTVAGLNHEPGATWAPRLTPEPVPATFSVIEWTERLRPAQTAQNVAASELAVLSGTLLVLVAVVALIGLFGLWTEETGARSRDVAIRRAVGASRATVIRERFFEALILVLIASGLGGCFAAIARNLAGSTWPGVVGDSAPVVIAGVLLGAALVCLLRGTTLSFQATPGGVLGAKSSLSHPKKDVATRGILPVLQLPLIVCLMAGTVMLWRGPLSLPAVPESASLGSPPGQLTKVQRYEFTGPGVVDLPSAIEEVQEIPGVHSVGYASPGTLLGLGPSHHAMTDCGQCFVGGLYVPFRGAPVVHHFVTPDTFRHAAIGVVDGRIFDGAEGRPVAVVSQRFAQQHFQGGDAVGRRLQVGDVMAGAMGGAGSGWYTVVGVVEDAVRWAVGAAEQPEGEIYLSAFQHPIRQGDLLVEWDPGPTRAQETSVAQAISNSTARVLPAETVSDYLTRNAAQIRWFGGVWSVLAALALLVGIFGVYSTVRVRTQAEVREIGIRRAVGATRRRIVARYVVQVLRLSVPGIAAGLWLALFVRAFLPAIPPFDLGAAQALLGLVVLPILGAVSLGAIRPAWLAAKAQPAEMLSRGI